MTLTHGFHTRSAHSVGDRRSIPTLAVAAGFMLAAAGIVVVAAAIGIPALTDAAVDPALPVATSSASVNEPVSALLDGPAFHAAVSAAVATDGSAPMPATPATQTSPRSPLLDGPAFQTAITQALANPPRSALLDGPALQTAITHALATSD